MKLQFKTLKRAFYELDRHRQGHITSISLKAQGPQLNNDDEHLESLLNKEDEK
jgi:hypothetical protein